MVYMEGLRKVVGNQPLILVGVAVAVINNEGEILLQNGWMGYGEYLEGLWNWANQPKRLVSAR